MNEETGTSWWVVKAQVHAGGRGKGGVKLAKSLDDVKNIANDILGMHLVIPQTSAEGKLVHQVLIVKMYIILVKGKLRILYVSITKPFYW